MYVPAPVYVGPITSTPEIALALSVAFDMPELERISNSRVNAVVSVLLSVVIIPPVLSAA